MGRAKRASATPKAAAAARKKKAAAAPVTPSPAPAATRTPHVEMDEWQRIEEEAKMAVDTPRPRRTPKPTRIAAFSPSVGSTTKRKETAREEPSLASKKGRSKASATPTPQRRRAKK